MTAPMRISIQQARMLKLIDDSLDYDNGAATVDMRLGRFRTLQSLLRRKLIRYGRGGFSLTAAGDAALREMEL